MDCFHCKLGIKEGNPPSFIVFDKKRFFCCVGCQSICDFIVQSGKDEYYLHRTINGHNAPSPDLLQFTENLKLFDNEQLQKQFVTDSDQGSWKETWLVLEDIRCSACMWLIERTLRDFDGVLDVKANYAGQQVRVRWTPQITPLSNILLTLTKIGYKAYPFESSQREVLNKEQHYRSIQRIIFALIIGMVVMQTSVGAYFYDTPIDKPLWIKISRWVNISLTLLLLLYPGALFYRNAFRDLANKNLGMDVPVAIGLSVAWIGSLYNTITGAGDVYLDSIAMFVLFLLVARHIELRARITATNLIDRYSKIVPQTARLIVGSSTKTIALFDLKVGDNIRVLPGEVIGVDAQLLGISGLFDESLITGESNPVRRWTGDRVLGGSVNIEQPIDAQVLTGVEDSTLGEITNLTRNAASFRPNYILVAEHVARYFVAIILAVASMTFIYWIDTGIDNALRACIAVLIVTCPCALALAAPVAMSLTAAKLTQMKTLPINMSSIEKIGAVDSVVFDKTGTITRGKPELDTILITGDYSEKKCLSIAARMEQHSLHPFAKAILNAFHGSDQPEKSLIFTKNKTFTGLGIETIIDNETWRLGTQAFVGFEQNDRVMPLTPEINEQINKWRKNACSVIFLGNKSAIQAVFCIIDPMRSGLTQLLEFLKNSGIDDFVILSGDHEQSVQAVAHKLGIHTAYGSMSPKDKLSWIQEQQQTFGRKMMMFGDGINDAPTLSTADVSLTFSEATDLAKINSDIILMGHGFEQLGQSFSLMKYGRNIILQNMAWAVAYNIVAIPTAAMGLVDPWMAAAGMSLSSLIVVTNSLRIGRKF